MAGQDVPREEQAPVPTPLSDRAPDFVDEVVEGHSLANPPLDLDTWEESDGEVISSGPMRAFPLEEIDDHGRTGFTPQVQADPSQSPDILDSPPPGSAAEIEAANMMALAALQEAFETIGAGAPATGDVVEALQDELEDVGPEPDPRFVDAEIAGLSPVRRRVYEQELERIKEANPDWKEFTQKKTALGAMRRLGDDRKVRPTDVPKYTAGRAKQGKSQK
jgi:hypothetical protein